MASKLSSTQADPRHGGDLPATVAKDRFAGVEEALAKLAHQAASDSPGPQNRAQPSEDSAAPSVAPPPDATLRPADFRDPLPSETPRTRTSGGARLLIAICIGAAVMLAWRSYGGVAREMVAAWAPQLGAISARIWTSETPANPAFPPAAAPAARPAPVVAAPAPPAAAPAAQPAPATVTPSESAEASADRRQTEAMTRELAALRQTVEQLTVGQEQLKGEIAKLQADKLQADKQVEKLQAEKLQAEKRVPRRVSAPSPPPIAAPARRPTIPPPAMPPTATMSHLPPPPPAAPQVSTVGPLVPPPPQAAPPIASEPQPAIEPPPMRPPMPVPQP